MNDGGTVQLKFDTAFAGIFDYSGKIIRRDDSTGFGLGIRPLRPRTLPSLPILPIISGVAMAISKSVQPSSIFLTRSSADKISAGGLGGPFCFALSKDQNADLFAQAVG